jgi:hypothetical protein
VKETLNYLFIRMWAPRKPTDTEEPEPYYVMNVDDGPGDTKWTVTQEFTEAHFFKRVRTPSRILKSVKRLAARIEDGWNYEIIHVEEEIVESNRPIPEEVPNEL